MTKCTKSTQNKYPLFNPKMFVGTSEVFGTLGKLKIVGNVPRHEIIISTQLITTQFFRSKRTFTSGTHLATLHGGISCPPIRQRPPAYSLITTAYRTGHKVSKIINFNIIISFQRQDLALYAHMLYVSLYERQVVKRVKSALYNGPN